MKVFLMKEKLGILLIISVVISTLSSFAVNVETTEITNDIKMIDDRFDTSSQIIAISPDGNNVQDGRYMTKLQWFSPNNELPGTYEEYLRRHPLTPARFSTPRAVSNVLQPTGQSISLLVDEDLYLGVSTAINQYIDDLELDGYSAYLQTVSGGTPEEIKAWITDRYNSGSTGIVFIGDITAAWAEVSESVFPCDLYYMDLDGNWEDQDLDGDYEIHTAGTGDQGPEVYVGRINAHTLNYDTEANMVNDYFAKAHAYRSGELTQPWRGLEYVDEDWFNMDVNLNHIYGENVTRYDYGFLTTGADYLNQIDLGQHFVQVCAHSYSGGHHFGTRPTESCVYAHVYVYSPSARAAKLILGSDDGIKAWLNGVNVCNQDVYREWGPLHFFGNVNLNEGWNQLLCKVSQGGSGYKLSARFTDSSLSPFPDLEYQLSDPDTHGPEGQFVRSWLLNGFHQDISDNFWSYLTTNYLGVNEGSINPSEGEMMGGKTWTRYDSGYPYIDLSDYSNEADFGACYAYVRVNADSDKSCQLWMGYDDGARVWLNGQQVLYDNRYGEFDADMTKINVNLNAGENRLLVKISEWMGSHGFSARFCQPDGSPVDGLTYDPEPIPISYIGTWLMNGPYINPDQLTRLSTDYLGDEANVIPSEGDPAPFGAWERGIGDGYPFDIGVFYDYGDWVLSDDIQNRDPPVLFYNLFACGPGLFTDNNYLAGAYIFHTTYGLITVASSKSGSMLNFHDFTTPLGESKSIGESFHEWFDAQAPFELWEKEWYYGMVVCGDPTLRILEEPNQPPLQPTLTGPTNGVTSTEYVFTTNTTDPESHPIYYIWDWGDELSEWLGPYDSGEPYNASHTWAEFGTYDVRVQAKDGYNAESEWSDVHSIYIACLADFDHDGDVDLDDFANFAQCYGGAGNPPAAGCPGEMFEGGFCKADFDQDGDIDLDDFAKFAQCYGGAGNPPAAGCPI